MNRNLVTTAAGLFIAGLVGCEGAVLVNNRPDATPNSVGSDNSQPASARETATSVQRSNSTNRDTVDATSANTASSTQPAQQVETKNTRIQLQNDSR